MKRRSTISLIKIAAIVLISFSHFPFALYILFSRELYYVVPVDTGLDIGIRGVIGGLETESLYPMTKDIEELFATTRFRSQLPILFHQKTLLERFPFKLYAHESLDHKKGIEILWIFDSKAAPPDVLNRPLYHFQNILDSIEKQVYEFHNYTFQILDSGKLDDKPEAGQMIVAALRDNFIAPLVSAIVVFFVLWIFLRNRTGSPIRESIVVCLIPVVISTIAFSIHSLGESGWFDPTYKDNQYFAWSNIAIERQFSFSLNENPIETKYLWSVYPRTQDFLIRADLLHPPYQDSVVFEVQLSDSTGLLTMSGEKKGWLSMPHEKWEEFWLEEPSPRRITKWLQTTDSLDKRKKEFENAFKILQIYADEQGVTIEPDSPLLVKNNYPHPPMMPISIIVISIITVLLSFVIYRLLFKQPSGNSTTPTTINTDVNSA